MLQPMPTLLSAQNIAGVKSGMLFSIGFGLNPELTASSGGQTGSGSFSSSFSFGLGYQEISVGYLGYSAEVEYNRSSSSATSFVNTSIIGNVNYGFSEKAYALGGLNYTNLSISGGSSSVSAGSGMGYQAGVGFNITEKSAIEIVKKSMKSELSQNGVSLDLETSALELRSRLSF